MRTHAVARSRGGFQEAVCRAIKRSVQATTKTTAKTQKASPLRNRLAIESAIVRWKIDQSHASVDRTRLRRPLSESVMTFGPFMAWDKSRPPRALIRLSFSRVTTSRNSPISLSYRYRHHRCLFWGLDRHRTWLNYNSYDTARMDRKETLREIEKELSLFRKVSRAWNFSNFETSWTERFWHSNETKSIRSVLFMFIG